MAEEKLDTRIPSEENGSVEPSNGNDEDPSELSPTLQNDDDEEKGVSFVTYGFPFSLTDLVFYLFSLYLFVLC